MQLLTFISPKRSNSKRHTPNTFQKLRTCIRTDSQNSSKREGEKQDQRKSFVILFFTKSTHINFRIQYLVMKIVV